MVTLICDVVLLVRFSVVVLGRQMLVFYNTRLAKISGEAVAHLKSSPHKPRDGADKQTRVTNGQEGVVWFT